MEEYKLADGITLDQAIDYLSTFDACSPEFWRYVSYKFTKKTFLYEDTKRKIVASLKRGFWYDSFKDGTEVENNGLIRIYKIINDELQFLSIGTSEETFILYENIQRIDQ